MVTKRIFRVSEHKDISLKNKIYRAVEKYHPILQDHIKKKITVVVCDHDECNISVFEKKGKVMMIGVPFVKYTMKYFKKSANMAVRFLMTHESIHLLGLSHDKHGYKLGYYSDMSKDLYTPQVEKLIFGGK